MNTKANSNVNDGVNTNTNINNIDMTMGNVIIPSANDTNDINK